MKAAVSRLDFGPKPKQMEVTDIRSGHFVFTPVAAEPVAFEALDRAIRGAGYEIESASIEVTGNLVGDDRLEVAETGQVFVIRPSEPAARPESSEEGQAATIFGRWSSADGVEVIEPRPRAGGGD